MQIPPILSKNEFEDMMIARESGLIQSEDCFKKLKELNLTNSSSFEHGHPSLMSLAQRKTWYFEQGNDQRDGCWLREHRRCVRPIIDFCNEVYYQGKLIPCKERTEIAFPALGVVPCNPFRSPKGTNLNLGEVENLRLWFNDNQNLIKENFPNTLINESVGIITPYKDQCYFLKSEFSKAFDDIPEIGTVHTFQGGEKEIILFTPSQYRGFYDRDNMLNVAVSRAKESFILFADLKQFGLSNYNSPSSMLRKKILSSEDSTFYSSVNKPCHIAR